MAGLCRKTQICGEPFCDIPDDDMYEETRVCVCVFEGRLL
jgi:hypothetical protein